MTEKLGTATVRTRASAKRGRVKRVITYPGISKTGARVSGADLSDDLWIKICSFLPQKSGGRRGRPGISDRQVLNGILWILQQDGPWKDAHSVYGKADTIYRRCRLWANLGVWDSLLPELVMLGLTNEWRYAGAPPVTGQTGRKGGRIDALRKALVESASIFRAGGLPVQSIREATAVLELDVEHGRE